MFSINGLPWWLSGKESICQAGNAGLIDPWVGKIPWRRKWHPTPVFLPGKSHGHRCLAGCGPWGCKRFGHNLVTNQYKNHSIKTLPWCSFVFPLSGLCYLCHTFYLIHVLKSPQDGVIFFPLNNQFKRDFKEEEKPLQFPHRFTVRGALHSFLYIHLSAWYSVHYDGRHPLTFFIVQVC